MEARRGPGSLWPRQGGPRWGPESADGPGGRVCPGAQANASPGLTLRLLQGPCPLARLVLPHHVSGWAVFLFRQEKAVKVALCPRRVSASEGPLFLPPCGCSILSTCRFSLPRTKSMLSRAGPPGDPLPPPRLARAGRGPQLSRAKLGPTVLRPCVRRSLLRAQADADPRGRAACCPAFSFFTPFPPSGQALGSLEGHP